MLIDIRRVLESAERLHPMSFLITIGIVCAAGFCLVAVFVRSAATAAILLASLSLIAISIGLTLDIARSGDSLAAAGAPTYMSPQAVADNKAILANLARQHYDQTTAIVRPCGKASKAARVYVVAAHGVQRNESWGFKIVVNNAEQVTTIFGAQLSDSIFPDPNPPRFCPTAQFGQ